MAEEKEFAYFQLPDEIEFVFSPEAKRLTALDAAKTREMKDKEVAKELTRRAGESAKPGDIFKFEIPRLALDVEVVVLWLSNAGEPQTALCLSADHGEEVCLYDASVYPKAICGPRLINMRVGMEIRVSNLDPARRIGYLEPFRLERIRYAYQNYAATAWMLPPELAMHPQTVRRMELVATRANRLLQYLNTTAR